MDLEINRKKEIEFVDYKPRFKTIKINVLESEDDTSYIEFINEVNDFCSKRSVINVYLKDVRYFQKTVFQATILQEIMIED